MSAVHAAWRIVRDASVQTIRTLPRSGWPIAALLIVQFVWSFVAVPLFMATRVGLLLGIVEALLLGWYLSLVEPLVHGRPKLDLSDVRSAFGSRFGEVIGILFAFWLPSFALQLLAPGLLPIASVLAAVLFNPVPELVYLSRNQSFALLGEAASFIQENWPEWFAAQLPPLIAVGGLAVVFGMAPGLDLAVHVAGMFGPWWGFALGGIGLNIQDGPVAAIGACIGAVFVHAVMVYRGRVYVQLAASNRRGRAWRERMM